MKAHIERNGKIQQIQYSGTVLGLLKVLKQNPEEVLVVRKGELLTLKDSVADKDEVKVLSVVSGG